MFLRKETTCPPFTFVPRLSVNCSDNELVFGTECNFRCDQGYPLNGSDVALCDRDDANPSVGFWNYGNFSNQPFCTSTEN